MPENTEFDTDVIVVGTGPAGATTALALAKYGVRTHMVSKWNWLANTPRAHITNQRAMEVLRARILDLRISEREAERARMRRTQVGTGDRSAKVRTYNFPQSRMTDHRIGLTTHALSEVLDGGLDEVVEALQLAAAEEEFGG